MRHGKREAPGFAGGYLLDVLNGRPEHVKAICKRAGLKRSRMYQLMEIVTGKKTIEKCSRGLHRWAIIPEQEEAKWQHSIKRDSRLCCGCSRQPIPYRQPIPTPGKSISATLA